MKGLQSEMSSVPSQAQYTYSVHTAESSFKNIYLCRWSRNYTFLWTPKVHKCSHKSTTPSYILSHLNAVQTLTLYFTRIHFNIFSYPQLGLPSGVFNIFSSHASICHFSLQAACTDSLILLDLNTLMILCYELKAP